VFIHFLPRFDQNEFMHRGGAACGVRFTGFMCYNEGLVNTREKKKMSPYFSTIYIISICNIERKLAMAMSAASQG